MRYIPLSLLATALLFVCRLAQADTSPSALSPETIIAARQAGFALTGGLFGAMKAAVDAGQSPMPFADGAKAVALWSKSIPSLFPLGTEQGHDTKAKPEVWSDAAGFKKAADNLTETAEKLAVAAESNDKAAFGDAFKATGKACGACHRTYRVRTPE